MKYLAPTALALPLIAAAGLSPALAHPGHLAEQGLGHSHWLALALALAAATGALALYLARRRRKGGDQAPARKQS